jgi:DHA1 family bicyclomycin/chloramphenicol resistance-like MFS transporter
LFCQSLAGLALVLGTWFHLLGLFSTIFLIWIFLSTQGFAFPNSSALCLAPFSKNAGTASALMGAIQLGFGAISTALVSIFNNGTPMPMAAAMCVCAISSFVVLLIGRRIIASAGGRAESVL